MVEEFLSSEEVFFDLLSTLPKFVDLDHLAVSLAQVPKVSNQRTAERLLADLVFLKRTLRDLPDIVNILKKCKAPMMKEVLAVLDDSTRNTLLELILTVLEENCVITKSNQTTMRAQLVFAVKAGISSLLDVGRAAYYEAVEAIHQEVAMIKEHNNLQDAKLMYSASRGYHLSVPKSVLESLPDNLLIQRVHKGKRVFCSTPDLISLDARQNEAFSEVLFRTDRVIEDLLVELRVYMV